MTIEELTSYIRSRILEMEDEVEQWGDEMDEWTQGNYDAYTHLLAKITSTPLF